MDGYGLSGESGIGAWQYGTPQQAKMAEGMSGMMAGTAMVDQMFLGMANGKDMMADMAQEQLRPEREGHDGAFLSSLTHGTRQPAAISI